MNWFCPALVETRRRTSHSLGVLILSSINVRIETMNYWLYLKELYAREVRRPTDTNFSLIFESRRSRRIPQKNSKYRNSLIAKREYNGLGVWLWTIATQAHPGCTRFGIVSRRDHVPVSTYRDAFHQAVKVISVTTSISNQYSRIGQSLRELYQCESRSELNGTIRSPLYLLPTPPPSGHMGRVRLCRYRGQV